MVHNLFLLNFAAIVVPFLKRNVLPVLEVETNEYLFSANAITRYSMHTMMSCKLLY